jgi:hypothetical protein
MEEKNLETLKAKTLSLPEKVKTIIIKGPEGIERANKALIYIKTIRKEIEDFFADTLAAAKESKKKADEAKKAVENLKASVEQPLIEAENYVKKLVADYRIEEERIKKDAEARAALGEETAQSRAIIEAPAAKTKGMYDVKIWKYRVVDIKLIPHEYWVPDYDKISELVQSSKGQMKIPGIETYFELSVRQRI